MRNLTKGGDQTGGEYSAQYVIPEQENTNNLLLELKISVINSSDLPSLATNKLFFSS